MPLTQVKLGTLDYALHTLNQIQRKWVYLEPIFGMGALPAEQGRFRRVEEEFRDIMAKVWMIPLPRLPECCAFVPTLYHLRQGLHATTLKDEMRSSYHGSLLVVQHTIKYYYNNLRCRKRHATYGCLSTALQSA